MIDLDELERLKNSAYRWHYTEKLLESAPELIAMARRYQWLRAHRIYENSDGSLRIEFHCIKERHMNDFNAAIDAAMQEQKT